MVEVERRDTGQMFTLVTDRIWLLYRQNLHEIIFSKNLSDQTTYQRINTIISIKEEVILKTLTVKYYILSKLVKKLNTCKYLGVPVIFNIISSLY